ncbi:signal transduction histidine kinase [Saccharococcus thermophilus]|uniref:histidine kinase n=1 Tax=Saccharococcus thermophilus TaxID=29396 RepID=A0A846M7W9_9BACL|nr:signal transduction histidine kinase [Saccharococcus thermophilus]
MFNRFYRTDESRTRNRGGTGLGLAIAKEFVLAHNGTTDVESTLGQGTTFIVKLPH